MAGRFCDGQAVNRRMGQIEARSEKSEGVGNLVPRKWAKSQLVIPIPSVALQLQ